MILLATAVDETLRDSIMLIVPEAALVGIACVLFVLSTLKANRHTAGAIALAGLGLAALLHANAARPMSLISTVSPVVGDHLAIFIRILALFTGAVLVLLSWDEPGDRRACDYQACLLCAVAGLSLVGAANDLIFLFLALELISIPTYVMLYLPKANDLKGAGSGPEVFLVEHHVIRPIAIRFQLSLRSNGHNQHLGHSQNPARSGCGRHGVLGIGRRRDDRGRPRISGDRISIPLLCADVYQGAPLGVVSLLSFVPKVAGFAAMLRLFGSFGNMPDIDDAFIKQYRMLLWILAAVTMTGGNVMALMQNNVRRMLAYSGVAQAGYILIGLAVLSSQQTGDKGSEIQGGIRFSFTYRDGEMTIGAFAVIIYLQRPERGIDAIDDLAGLH